MRTLGTLGNDRTVQAMAEQVYASGSADAAVQSAVVPILAHVGGAARFDEFRGRYTEARTPQEEQRYLLALTGFRDAALIDRR